MAKITYADKTIGSKWKAIDANEVKESVNDLYDVVDSTSADVLQKIRVVCWGDSLTQGGLQGSGYVNQLADALGLSTSNKGVGGESSVQIKARFDADPADWIYPTIIWSGRNNFSNPTQVKSDIAGMVASLGHTNYLILSILNSDTPTEYIGQPNYVTITTLNSDLATIYGERFLDVRAYLLTQGNGSAADNTDVANGVPPESLRSDAVHLNALGDSKVVDYIVANGAAFITPDINKPVSINSLRTLFNNAPNIGGEVLAKGYFDRLMVGSNDNTLAIAPFSVFTTTNLREHVNINAGGEALRISVDTGDPEQVFMGFFVKGATPTVRSASVGYNNIGDVKFTINNNIGRIEAISIETASDGLARGLRANGSLTASANNDVLVGIEVDPGFNSGGFTGITNIALRALGTVATDRSLGRFAFSVGASGVRASIRSNTNNDLIFGPSTTSDTFQLFANGNAIHQNGGTFTDDGVNRLQVTGSIKATQYNISALNTAPATATSTGTQGEIRWTATHVYFCTATNTWVRAALATW